MKKSIIGIGLGVVAVAGLGLSAIAQTPQPLTLAVVPTEGTADATQRYSTLVAYLEKTLGTKVTFRNGTDYAAVIVAMAAKQVDIGFFGPSSYLDAEDRASAEAFARLNSTATGLGYYSILVSKAGGPIKTLADAKGQEFAFVDPASTSGFRVPMFNFCTELKIEPEQYFKRVFFAGTHENVILGVANGRIPVGATNDQDMAQAVEKGVVKAADFTTIYKSKMIPAAPLAYRKDLPADLKAKIKDAFLKFNDAAWLKEQNLKGYAEASPADYQSFRQINSYKSTSCPK